MKTLGQAREFLRRNPQEAAADLIGVALICAFVAAGFSLPGFL